jgi:hypothetical protein
MVISAYHQGSGHYETFDEPEGGTNYEIDLGIQHWERDAYRAQILAISAWVKSAGYEVSSRGRISRTIQGAFDRPTETAVADLAWSLWQTGGGPSTQTRQQTSV